MTAPAALDPFAVIQADVALLRKVAYLAITLATAAVGAAGIAFALCGHINIGGLA
jgi:hypothetical protein